MQKRKYFKAVALVFSFQLLNLSVTSFAQDRLSEPDSSYYAQFHHDLVFRIYASRKYSMFSVGDRTGNEKISYRANTTNNLGVGVSYRNISLNIAYGFGFLNPRDGKVKTKKLDLQARLYGRKWLIDLAGEFFSGYYLYPKGKDAPLSENYYNRPDIHLVIVGGSGYKLFNSGRLSVRQGFIMDEWQKRSAGSFLAGGGVHYADVWADSSLIPVASSGVFNVDHLLKARSWIFSPGIGYTYTLVLPAHFFISGTVTGQLNIALVKEDFMGNVPNEASVKPSISHKLAGGYFDGTWSLAAFWVNNRLSVKAPSDSRYLFDTGILRIMLSRRLMAPGRLKRL